MKYNYYLLIMNCFIFLNILCKRRYSKNSYKRKSLDLQVLAAYEEGKKALNEGDVLFAAKKFNEAEILFSIRLGT